MILPWLLVILILAMGIAGLIYATKRKVKERHGGDPVTGRR